MFNKVELLKNAYKSTIFGSLYDGIYCHATSMKKRHLDFCRHIGLGMGIQNRPRDNGYFGTPEEDLHDQQAINHLLKHKA